jgi:hypothetical protein
MCRGPVGHWAGLVVAAPFVLGLASTSGTRGDHVLTFTDPAIVEASALVVEDGLFLTTNDSGDTGRVFAVAKDGRTVGVTNWSSHPTDCEALAPAGPGAVWVGDIGDNLARRSTVSITRVPVGRGDRAVGATTYRLRYPDGAHDAETLLRSPRTGRLYIATKGLFGGGLYAVPAHLSATAVNPLRRLGGVLPVATDGSFFPDGAHLVIRNYTSATIYDWPSLHAVASFPLPSQQQGEGIAVTADDTVYVSSEGVRSAVLRVVLPAGVRRALAPAGPSPTPSPTSSPAPSPTTGDPARPNEVTDTTSRSPWPWALGGLLAAGALLVLLRALRPR